jgi:hypothetical protein
VRLGESEEVVQKALDDLRAGAFANVGNSVDVAGSTFDQLRPDPDAPVFTWGIHDGLFILGAGEGVVEGVIARAKTPAPQWLIDLENEHPLPRRATLTYADLGRLMELAIPVTGDPQAMQMLDSIGLSQLKSYVSVTGLNETKVVGRTLIRIEGQPRGLLAMMPKASLAEEDLRAIPKDATVALAFRADGTAVFETALEMIGLFEPRSVSVIDDRLNELKQGLGIDIRQDLLGSLGDTWQLYTSPGNGGLLVGWTACVSVEDPETLAVVHNKLLGVINGQAFREDGTGLIRTTRQGDLTIHTLSIPDDDFFIAPSWCISDGQLAIAMFPQAIKAHFARKNLVSLAANEHVARVFDADKPPFAIAYYDTKTLFRSAYPWLQMGARMMAAEMQREGLDVNIAILPSAYAIERHLRPGIILKRRTEDGVEIESFQSVPAGTAGVTGPLLAAMAFPALQSSRAASYRMQSSNNMRSIGLAWHNFHDAYNAFPAAFNTDEEGNALLSWRVHILPYLGEQELYGQFHLDEPWNSEHNRKLIRRMPVVYKAPGSLAEPGKTNYLGIVGDQAVLVAPKQEFYGQAPPRGIGFRDMTDGTSNTIGAVEVNDALAVIWTKPDDLKPDNDDPIQGLVGLRPGMFLALVCDGSVQSIAKTIDKRSLKALFTRNGGERVDNF